MTMMTQRIMLKILFCCIFLTSVGVPGLMNGQSNNLPSEVTNGATNQLSNSGNSKANIEVSDATTKRPRVTKTTKQPLNESEVKTKRPRVTKTTKQPGDVKTKRPRVTKTPKPPRNVTKRPRVTKKTTKTTPLDCFDQEACGRTPARTQTPPETTPTPPRTDTPAPVTPVARHQQPCSLSEVKVAACLNGGECYAIDITGDGTRSVFCHCTEFYKGSRCEQLDEFFVLYAGEVKKAGIAAGVVVLIIILTIIIVYIAVKRRKRNNQKRLQNGSATHDSHGDCEKHPETVPLNGNLPFDSSQETKV